MVAVPVGQQDLRYLLGLIAESAERLPITANILTCIGGDFLVGLLLGSARGKSRID